mgnify:CR=1 FL=1
MDIAALQAQITALFGARDRERGVDGTFRRLVEEVGELAKALREADHAAIELRARHPAEVRFAGQARHQVVQLRKIQEESFGRLRINVVAGRQHFGQIRPPGAMQFDVTLNLPSSSAITRVRLTMPPLAAE